MASGSSDQFRSSRVGEDMKRLIEEVAMCRMKLLAVYFVLVGCTVDVLTVVC